MSLFTLQSREEDGPRTIAVRQIRDKRLSTPVLVIEEDDGSITVRIIPNVTVLAVDRTVHLNERI